MTDKRSKTDGDSVKVAVRVRPFNDREQSDSLISIVKMLPSKKTVSVRNPEAKDGGATTFPFDNVFWSMSCNDDEGGPPASQADVYENIGKPLIQNAFGGYNSCLFAYGQTGSGKTHTMMGGGSFDAEHCDAGIIPRLCRDMFIVRDAVEQKKDCKWSVEVGFIEVYNEKVSDLLADRKESGKGRGGDDVYLEVREHPLRGVFVENQTFRSVDGPADIANLIEMGNLVRHVAATKMNNRSSRSHAIFQIVLREERISTGTVGKNSRMNLVDLAGSERVAQSQVVGQQFNEAKFINLSLTTLGRVIDILADMAKKDRAGVPPYRESKLTFLLKDSLGGNSKTFMVAAVSPSAMNYDESLSTLRYASRARDIVNTAKMNEDPRAKRIRELEERIASMQAAGLVAGGGADPAVVAEMEAKIRMMQSEAQQQIAELQTLRLEREKAEMTERLMKATQEEKQQLQAKADELEMQMRQTRAQADFHVKELQRLKDEREEFEEKVRAQHAEMEMMQRQLSEMKDGQEQLKKTMADLDREKESKQEALKLLEAQKRALNDALAKSAQSVEERALLEKQNEDLALRIRQVEQESINSSRIKAELEAVQQQMDQTNSLSARAAAELDELDVRRRVEQAHHFTVVELMQHADSGFKQWALQEIITLRIDRDNLAQTLSESTTEMEAITAQLTQTSAERDALKLNLKDLGAKLAQTSAERDDLGAKLTQTSAERDDLVAKLTQTSAERDDLVAKLTQTSAERDEVVSKLAMSVDEVFNLSTSLSEMSRKVELFTKRFALAERNVAFLNARIKVQRDLLEKRVNGQLDSDDHVYHATSSARQKLNRSKIGLQ